MKRKIILLVLFFSYLFSCAQQNAKQTNDSILEFPILVKREQLYAGNPLAQYIALTKMESRYLNSVFKEPYKELLKNFEQFLGFPMAGVEAMQLKTLKQDFGERLESPGPNYTLVPAITVIKEQAKTQRIVIWGEEHHLPQTRSLYEEMIRELWHYGFRYLAAESFTDKIENRDLKYVNYECGLYTRDPIFSNAVNAAIQIGYKLIAYDNKEKERDKVQAENIYKKVFEKDPAAKILILAGRSHIVEEKTADGWEPMGYWLKKMTGIDPFTIYAPVMSERLTPQEEHPVYKYITQNVGLNQVSILKDSLTGKFYGNDRFFDAYVFFPRVLLDNNRPDWLYSVIHRKPVSIPKKFLRKHELVLIQAFTKGQLVTDIPFDQVTVSGKTKTKLALAPGAYNIRAVYEDESVSKLKRVKIK
jgi:hypothetical protein